MAEDKTRLLKYKCPRCGAELNFDSKTQLMVCEYCDSKYSVEQLSMNDSGKDKQEEEKDSAEYEWKEYEEKRESGENIRVITCPTCGAELETNGDTIATECSYCGNPVVISESVSGHLKPDLIIPFKLGKEEAKKALKAYYKGKKLIPDVFSDENHIEKLTGIYVPFWLFDCDTSSAFTYRAERVRAWSTSNYIFTETSHFNIIRSGNVSFEKIPADCSTRMDDRYMDAIEPFNFKEAEPFQSAFMAGYAAEKYNVTSEESKTRVNSRVQNSICDIFRGTVRGYSHVAQKSASVKSVDGRIQYALLPVWMLQTKYKDKNYMFAMNGQTGKMVGELPVDAGKFWKLFGLTALITAAIAQLMLLFI